MEPLTWALLAALVVAAATTFSQRAGVAAPLLLVGVGAGVSLLPFVAPIEVDPEWVIAGILPPLLYSAAVAIPPMNLRREFGAVSQLSVVLVLVSSLVVGGVLSLLVPGLSLAWGIALGAIVSPTDAVATAIVKRHRITPRVTTLLDGEGLLNDASALVLLRAAVAAAAGSFTLAGTAGTFVFSVALAGLIGWAVGRANLWLRSRTDATVSTLLSFAAPFAASLPAEHLGASGLVAAVVAGLVTGRRAPRALSAQHRLSDRQNWQTVELMLEGGVFLLMGLQFFALLEAVRDEHAGVGVAALSAAVALGLALAVRAAYVAPLLVLQARRARRGERVRPRVAEMHERLDGPEPVRRRGRGGHGRPLTEREVERFRTRIRRFTLDLDYVLATPLTWREGVVVVWAGMRGAVTVAAAQTLPPETPQRPLLLLIAFGVATSSLLLQGGTLGRLIAWVRPAARDPEAERTERREVAAMLREIAASVPAPEASRQAAASRERRLERRLEVLARQRLALLDARDDGRWDAEVLEAALTNLDADQISLELRSGDGLRRDAREIG